MATFTTDRTAPSAIAKYLETGVFSDTATYEFTGEAAASIVQMIKVAGADSPGGITILEMILVTDDLGTLTANVGDGNSATRFMSGVDVGASGTPNCYRMGGFPYTYTTNDTIDLATVTGAATGTATLTVFMKAGGADLT